MKEFDFNSDILQILLEHTPESFVKSFNQNFYLDGEALELLLKYLPTKENYLCF